MSLSNDNLMGRMVVMVAHGVWKCLVFPIFCSFTLLPNNVSCWRKLYFVIFICLIFNVCNTGYSDSKNEHDILCSYEIATIVFILLMIYSYQLLKVNVEPHIFCFTQCITREFNYVDTKHEIKEGQKNQFYLWGKNCERKTKIGVN